MDLDGLTLWGRRSSSLSKTRDHRSRRRLILLLRLVALTTSIAVLVLTWTVLERLPWQIDVGLAATAALLWSYKFENAA